MRELPGTAIGEARTEGAPERRPASARRGFLIATIAALAMILTGAFGTGEMPLLRRALYWLLVMESGALIGVVVTIGVRSWGGLYTRPVAEGMLVSALIAFPLTLVVLGATQAFIGGAVSPTSIALLFGMVLAVTGLITTVNYATARPAPVIAPPNAPVEPARHQRPRLAERLPAHLRDAPIHALQAEDHYLRVHTDAGSCLILMRLGDAIAELDGLDGARTHRSWWVARAAILGVVRKEGRAELTIPDGSVVPVSRSAYPELRAAGWFG